MLRLCWLKITDVRPANNITRDSQITRTTVAADAGGQTADHANCSAILLGKVMKAQTNQPPAVLLPLGHTVPTSFSEVQIFDHFVQKRITFSNESWPLSRCQLMTTVYAASKNCPFLIHAQEPPHTSQNGKQYVMDLEPIGQPAISKFSDCKPRRVHELKDSLR